METNDNPSAQRSPLLAFHPFQPSSLQCLADREMSERVLRLAEEQRRREQARWEEAEPISALTAGKFCTHTNLAPFGGINNMSMNSGTDAVYTGTTRHSLGCKNKG